MYATALMFEMAGVAGGNIADALRESGVHPVDKIIQSQDVTFETDGEKSKIRPLQAAPTHEA